MLDAIHAAHEADVAVENILVVIVDSLHDLVPGPVGDAKQPPLGLLIGSRIEPGLHALIERAHPCRAAIDRSQHLDLAQRIQPKLLRDAFGNHLHHPVGGRLGILGGEQEEIAAVLRDQRQFPPVDQVGIGNDLRIGGLAEDTRQARHRHQAAGDQIAQHIARPDRGQLIHIADQEQLCAGRHRLEQVIGQQQVEHRGFVYHQVIDLERVFLVALEAQGRGGFQQAVDGTGRVASRFGQTLGGPPGGRGQRHPRPAYLECADQRFQAGGFSGARPARQHADRLLKRHLHCAALFVGQVGNEEGGLYRPSGCAGQGFQPLANAYFSKVERCQVDDRIRGVSGARLRDAHPGPGWRRVERYQFRANAIFGGQAFQRGRDQVGADAEQFHGAGCQHRARGIHVTVVDQFVQREDHPGFDARRVFGQQTEGLGDAVGCFESHTIDIAFELVGIFLDGFERGVAVGFVNLDRQVGADPVAVQEDHDFLDLLLLLPGGGDLPGSVQANAGHFAQAFRRVLDDLKGFFFKVPHNALGHLGTDAFDHARAEVTLHARQAGRQALFAEFGFELGAVLGMRVPLPLQADMFARRQFRQVADHRRQAIVTQAGDALSARNFRAQAQDGVAVFRIVVGDALNRSGEFVHTSKYTRGHQLRFFALWEAQFVTTGIL